MKRMIIDCDPGHDDAIALILAHRVAEVVGITTVSGNAPLAATSPRFFGDGALNLELFAKRRSELWVLVKDDIGVVRKGGQRQVVTRLDVAVIGVASQDAGQMDAKNAHRLLLIVDEDGRTDLSGHYIRLPGWAFDAYGDLVLDCDTHGVVWTGHRVTFVASDGISAQFQYDIRLDEIVAVDVGGMIARRGSIGVVARAAVAVWGALPAHTYRVDAVPRAVGRRGDPTGPALRVGGHADKAAMGGRGCERIVRGCRGSA